MIALFVLTSTVLAEPSWRPLDGARTCASAGVAAAGNVLAGSGLVAHTGGGIEFAGGQVIEARGLALRHDNLLAESDRAVPAQLGGLALAWGHAIPVTPRVDVRVGASLLVVAGWDDANPGGRLLAAPLVSIGPRLRFPGNLGEQLYLLPQAGLLPTQRSGTVGVEFGVLGRPIDTRRARGRRGRLAAWRGAQPPRAHAA